MTTVHDDGDAGAVTLRLGDTEADSARRRPSTGVDRRSFLRAAAMSTAVVWAAPTITGVGLVPAAANGSPPPGDPDDRDPDDRDPDDRVPDDPPPGQDPDAPRPDTPTDDDPVVLDEPPLERGPDGPTTPGTGAPDTGGATPGAGGTPIAVRPPAGPDVLDRAVERTTVSRRLPRTGVDADLLLGGAVAALAGGTAMLRAARTAAADDGADPTPGAPGDEPSPAV